MFFWQRGPTFAFLIWDTVSVTTSGHQRNAIEFYYVKCRRHVINAFYYMPSTLYIVKLPLALGNIFNWTESIMAQSHDDAKNPYWGLFMDFWHCLIVMTYRNRALFRLELGQATRFNMAE